MELGLEGKTALVCGSSSGLGKACAMELARNGVTVFVNGRTAERTQRAADEIHAETGAKVIAVAADLSNAIDRQRLLGEVGEIDILVTNNGGPPPVDFRTLDRDALIKGIDANMLIPIHLIQGTIDGMIARRFGRIVNITSASVKMPMQGLDLSSGARAGLTAFVSGIARSVAEANVTINNLLPGTFETDRILSMLENGAARSGKSAADIRAAQESVVPAKRFGDPDEFGKACAFLCAAHAGYITGQSLLIDGGKFPGVM